MIPVRALHPSKRYLEWKTNLFEYLRLERSGVFPVPYTSCKENIHDMHLKRSSGLRFKYLAEIL